MYGTAKYQLPAGGKSRTSESIWLGLARMLSLGMSFVLAAILSRYMTVDGYGTYRQVLYVYTTLLTFFAFGLPQCYSYFPSVRPVNEGRSIIKKLNSLFIFIGALFSLLLFFGSDLIADILKNRQLAESLRWFAPTPMLMMPIIGIEGILVVYKQAHLVFIYVLLSKIFTISCVLAAVYVSGASAVNAIIGLVLAYAMTSFVGFRLMYRPFKDIAVLQSCISIKDIFSYSIPVFNASVYGFIIGSASQFFVSRYFGVAEFAQFANGFMELPFAGVIIAVIASVMLPEFSRMYAAGTAKEEYILLWNRTVFQSASLIYPISIFCFIFAEDIITCLYGPKYGIASDLFRIITIINIARILPYRPIMFALGKGKLFADIHLFTAVLVVGLDIACVNFFPSVTGIALISTGTTLLCLYLLMMSVSKMLGTNVGSLMPWRKLGILLVCSLCSGLASKTATTIFGTATHGMSLGLGGIVFILGYGCLSYLAGIRYSHFITQILSILKLK